MTECAMTLSDAHGVIKSPGFPENYPNFVDCTWLIKADLSVGQFIEINFISFDLEDNDYACR